MGGILVDCFPTKVDGFYLDIPNNLSDVELISEKNHF